MPVCGAVVGLAVKERDEEGTFVSLDKNALIYWKREPKETLLENT